MKSELEIQNLLGCMVLTKEMTLRNVKKLMPWTVLNFPNIREKNKMGKIRKYDNRSTIHNRQNMETTQVSVDRCIDEQNVAYIYKGISFSLKNEGYFLHATYMNHENIMLSELSSHKRIKIDDSTYIRSLGKSDP